MSYIPKSTTDYQGKNGDQNEYDAVRQRIVDFGKANNRRVTCKGSL